jgi:hypothetical protein
MSTAPHYTGPAELTVRLGANDELFVRQLFGLAPGSRPAPHLPVRLVVDAHVPLSSGAMLCSIARDAGVPFLIDPETHYLQDTQHADAPWCKVPFANPNNHTPADLMSTPAQDALVKAVIDYQVQHGATAVIAPYVHIDRPDSRWPEVQAALWDRTAAYVAEAGIHLPVIAVAAVGWRCLHPLQGMPHLAAMWDALADLDPAEIALAASKVHMGAKPQDRIAELLMVVRDLSRDYKVTMWQQGLLGEICIVEGAAGYECGIGWREKCDLQTRKTELREPSTGGGYSARPVFISELGRGVPKVRLELARTNRRVWARLVCPFPDCCAPAGMDLLGDARRHSVVARVRELEQLDATHASSWRWNRLTQRALEGIDLAHDINALAPASRSMPSIDITTLLAIYEVANARRSRRAVIRRTA